MTGFFSCIIPSLPHIQGEVLQCSLHLYFQILSLSHHSLIPSILLLSASRYFADTVYLYILSPRTFDHLYSQSRGEFTAHTPTSCISSRHLEVYKWMRGLRVVSVRLSWDHLAHLIKHRSFNLVLRSQRTTSTVGYSSRTHTHACTDTYAPPAGNFLHI